MKIVVFSVLVIAAAAAQGAEVRLHSAAVCGGSVTRVADVAEIFAADHRVADALADIPLCPAPPSGESRVLTQEEIRQLLDLSGVDRKTATVTGSETVKLTRETSPRLSPVAKQPLVAGGVRQAVFEVDVEPWAKRQSVQPATSQSPAANESKTVKTAPLIEKGASLTVYARAAGVRITAAGKAIDSGSVGEAIGVELIDTKQKVIGRIVGPQSVEITADTSSQK